MAGTIIADYIRTDANQLSLNVGNTTFATINAGGFYSNTGVQIISPTGAINAASIAAGSIPVGKLGAASVSRTNMYSGAVLQVVSTTKTDVFSMSGSGTATAITGLSASITPTSSSSKILIFGQVTGSMASTTYGWNIVLYKNGSVITGATGDSGNSQPRATSGMYHGYAYGSETIPFTYFDSPATTSATTYQIYTFQEPGSTFYINRPGNVTFTDGRTANHISTITVMEIAA